MPHSERKHHNVKNLFFVFLYLFSFTAFGQSIDLGVIPSSGGGGVSSLNGITGAATIVAGSGISVTVLGQNITIANTGAGSGTVTSVSVVSANGFAGTVATSTTTPAITLSTSITGVLKGNGTAISAATSGTDYSPGTSANSTGIVKSTTGTGALSTAIAADFPTLNQNTSGTALNITASSNSTLTTLSALSLPFTQLSGSLASTQMPALTGDVTASAGTVATTVVALQGVSVSSTAPTSGQDLVYNGTAWSPSSLSNTFRVIEDFATGDYQSSGYIASENTWRSIQSGSPAFTTHGGTIPSTSAHPGVLQITISASGTDVGSVASGEYNVETNSFLAVGGGAIQIDTVFDIPVLSDGTNNSEFDFGLIDSQPGSAPTNAIFIQYQRESSLNWRCTSEAASTATTTNSSVAVTSGWHHGTITVNAAGTSIAYSMDGVSLCTITTNIPSSPIQYLAGYRKTLGAGAMVVGIDYIEIYKNLTTPR